MDNLPKRKQLRLKNYDYSQSGRYFVTICTKDRQRLFCSVGADVSVRPRLNGDCPQLNDFRPNVGTNPKPIINLSPIGKIVDKCWNDINKIYPNVRTDYYVIMPDHFHGIIIIKDDFTDGQDVLTGGRDVLTGERDVLTGERDVLNDGRDVLTGGRDVLTGERDVLTGERGVLTGERDVLLNGGRDILLKGGQSRPPLQKIVQGFKSVTTRMCFEYGYNQIWQRGYYERIIRDEINYIRTVEYILNNPLKWKS